MRGIGGRSTDEMIEGLDELHAVVSQAQRNMLQLIAEADRAEAWRDSGARDMAHWLQIRYGISCWKAHRWVAAAHALDGLPLLAGAFSSGALRIDKVVELARFAAPETEAGLIEWAREVSSGCIRRRADLESRPRLEDTQEADRCRFLWWWYTDEGRRFGLEAELPAAEGAVVVQALERMKERVATLPDEDDQYFAPARRADALVALCSATVAGDPDPDRATVVVHATLESLLGGDRGCEVEGGGVIHPETARRLLCTARVQAVIEDRAGNPVSLGRIRREPSPAMLRQLRYRDRECRFPGCGARQFTQAHHIVWWQRGGSTDLENLLLVCTFHHKLVHEHGWGIRRDADGTVTWFRPDGRRYGAGPSPPHARAEEPLEAVGA